MTSSMVGKPLPGQYIHYEARLPTSVELLSVSPEFPKNEEMLKAAELFGIPATILTADYSKADSHAPAEMPVRPGELLAPPLLSANSYTIVGKLGTELVDRQCWKEQPHKELANLRAAAAGTGPESGLRWIDPEVAQNFIKEHGLVCGLAMGESTSKARFAQNSLVLSKLQDVLRKAWIGDSIAIEEIRKEANQSIEFRPSLQAKGVQMVATQLWSLVCLQFLNDWAAGRTGVCANPTCPRPYFLKSRKTQRFCTASCKKYGHRQDALKYWREKGDKKRRSKQTVARGGKNGGKGRRAGSGRRKGR